MSLETMIGALSRDQKLAAMDLIWQELARESQSFESPQWHQSVLANRLENPAVGESLPLDQAKSEVKKAIDARRTSG